MTFISKFAAPKRDGNGKGFRLVSSFFPIGTCPTRTVLMKSARARERVLRRKGAALLERPQRNLGHEPKCPLLFEYRKRRAVTHEEEKANVVRCSSVHSWPAVSWFARESCGPG